MEGTRSLGRSVCPRAQAVGPGIVVARPVDGATIHAAMVDRETFDLIKEKHGAYASWAVWAKPTGGRPKSNIADLTVLDPDQNPRSLETLRNDVVIGLNLSRFFPMSFGNFHDPSPEAQDYKIRYAFADTPYYGAYMTDLIKGVVMLESSKLMRHLVSNPSLVSENVKGCSKSSRTSGSRHRH